MTIESNDKTIYGIKTDAERYFWIGYLSTVVISSLVGDVVILVASKKSDVFKLNGFLIGLIQHIAISDLIMSVGYISPIIVSLVLEKWVFGDYIAYTHEFFAYSVFPVTNILVCALTTSKYLMIRYRLQVPRWTKKKAHLACGFLWISCVVFSFSLLIINKMDLRFDYTSYEVDFVRSKNYVWTYAGLTVGLLYCIPIVAVILSSVLTFKFLLKARKISRRGGGTLRWQGMMAVLLTGIVYCVSSLPYTVYKMRRPFVPETPPGYFHIQFKRHSEYMTLLNVMANFYIYSLTVRSFRRFIWSKITMVTMVTSHWLSCDRKNDLKTSTAMLNRNETDSNPKQNNLDDITTERLRTCPLETTI